MEHPKKVSKVHSCLLPAAGQPCNMALSHFRKQEAAHWAQHRCVASPPVHRSILQAAVVAGCCALLMLQATASGRLQWRGVSCHGHAGGLLTNMEEAGPVSVGRRVARVSQPAVPRSRELPRGPRGHRPLVRRAGLFRLTGHEVRRSTPAPRKPSGPLPLPLSQGQFGLSDWPPMLR